jgi:hypothetical protein
MTNATDTDLRLRLVLGSVLSRLRLRGIAHRWMLDAVQGALDDAGIRALVIDLDAFDRDRTGKRVPKRCPVRNRDGGYEVYEVRWFSRLQPPEPELDAP